MKKTTLIILIVSVAALVFAGAAFAQTDTPLNPGFGGGGRNSTSQVGTGWLHDYMIEYYAAAFDMDAAVLNERLLAGETMADIAFSLGYTVDEFSVLMTEARQYALDSALADGLITQDQYDLMITRGLMGAGGGGNGGGMGNGRGGGRHNSGTGTGINYNPDCPYNTVP